MTRTHALLTASFLSLALLGGCDKDGEAKTDAKTETEKEKPAPKKEMAELFPSKSVELPPPLAGLEFGMTEAAAEKVLKGISNSLVDLEGHEHITAGSFFNERGEEKVLITLRLSVDKEAGDVGKLLTETWGEPRKVTELGKVELMWLNPEKGIRARLKEGFADNKNVEFSKYMPFEKLIGTDKTKFGFEKEPLLGMDLKGLHDNYGDVLQVLTKEQAEKKREEMKKMFGDKIDMLGDAQASTDIHLPPTELESFTTTVWPRFNKESGKIESVRMTVPFEGEEGAADALMGVMKKAWGDPKEEEKYGKKRYVFNEKPFVVVEDSIGRSWEIEMLAERD